MDATQRIMSRIDFEHDTGIPGVYRLIRNGDYECFVRADDSFAKVIRLKPWRDGYGALLS